MFGDFEKLYGNTSNFLVIHYLQQSIAPDNTKIPSLEPQVYKRARPAPTQQQQVSDN
ncbi:hypothetical protein QCA50_009598 [Cerrena zonata]|uniref:Uncharacterized protein n=1 Tax=Cerrena zonata TaxID=2478898 RepID=A0AAW0G407_9APHY